MLFLIHIILILFYILGIILNCLLFTNAIEYLGEKLKLGQNATGAILTVIGTTLPETIVPLVAIIGGYLFKENIGVNEDVALGAIIGSPFILSTFAFFMLGIVLIFKKKKEICLDYKNVIRDYKYFFCSYPFAILAAFIPAKFRFAAVLYLVILYCVFVYRTLIKSKQEYEKQELEGLLFSKFFKKTSVSNFSISLQTIISLMGLILFSKLFMSEIIYSSSLFNVSPLILSLVLTPFATELPECTNSIIWLRDNKGDLAVANILGAVIFQSMVLTSIGMLLTPWTVNRTILLNAAVVILCCGVLFLFVIKTKTIKLLPLLLCGVFYFLFFILVSRI